MANRSAGQDFCGFVSGCLLYFILDHAGEISFENAESQFFYHAPRTNHKRNNFVLEPAVN